MLTCSVDFMIFKNCPLFLGKYNDFCQLENINFLSDARTLEKKKIHQIMYINKTPQKNHASTISETHKNHLINITVKNKCLEKVKSEREEKKEKKCTCHLSCVCTATYHE